MNVLSKRVPFNVSDAPEISVLEPEVSVLMPAYNEVNTISKVVKEYYDEICGKLPAELIIAEDGSTDGTKEILCSLRNDFPLVVRSDPNRKGYAKGVGDALRRCNRDWVFFSDSDGQYSPSDFWSLWKYRHDYDMVVGCKVRRNEGMHRIVLAKGFHKVVNLSFDLDLQDADCGFRLIRREVIKSVIDSVKFLKYSFWAEFTIRASLKGFKICEVPINHSSRTFGNSQIYKPSKIPIIILKQLSGLMRLFADTKKGC
jgi:glycosyltransferase involved in cell wall biosynthesis